MKLIVIKNQNETVVYNKLISNLTKHNEKFIILALRGTKNLINSNSKSEEDYYYNLNKDIFFEAVKLYSFWGSRSINDTTIREFLKFDNVDMWDYMESNFISYLYEYFNDRLQMIKLIKRVVIEEEISFVYFVNDDSVISNAILDVTNYYKIPIVAKRKYRLPEIRFTLIKFARRYRRTKFNRKIDVKKNQVLFIISLNSAIYSLEPVIKKIKGAIVVRQEIRAKQQLEKPLHDSSIDYTNFEDFCSNTNKTNIKNFLKEYKKRFKLLTDINFTYLDIPLNNSLKFIFDYFFGKRLFIEEILYVHEVGRNMIDMCRPSLVFGMDECSGLAKPIYNYCRQLKIPLLYMQNGILNNREPTSYNSPVLDYYLAYGQKSQEFYKKRGIKNTIITGWPKLDSVLEKRDKEIIMNKLGLPNKKIILFTSAVHKSINLPIFITILQTTRQLKDFQVIVKRHPGDEITVTEYLKQSSKYKIEVTILDFNLYDLFYISDIVISFGSSTILEALAFDKYVISLNLTGTKDDLPYVGTGVCYEVYKKEDLNKSINEVLNDKKIILMLQKSRRKMLKELFFKIDGKSTQRVVDVIDKIKLK